MSIDVNKRSFYINKDVDTKNIIYYGGSSSISASRTTYIASSGITINNNIISVFSGNTNEVGIVFSGSTGITFTGDIYVDGNIRAYGDVSAFSSVEAPINWWDNLPSEISNIIGSGLTVQDGLLYTTGGSGGTGTSQWTTTGSDIYYASGKVGIGTANPLNLFDVKVATNQHIGIRQANSYASIGTFNDAGTSYVRLDIDALTLSLNAYSSGNVGIGTSSPDGKFHVYYSAGSEFWTKDNGDGIILVNDVAAKSIGLTASQNGTYGGNGSAGIKIIEGNGSVGSGTVNIVTDGTIIGTFKGSNFGIGTSSPDYQLTTNNSVRLNNVFVGEYPSTPAYAMIAHKDKVNTTAYGLLAGNNGYTFLNKESVAGTYIGFRVNNTDKMVLSNDGYVGIGTTSPDKPLHVANAFSGWLGHFYNTTAGGANVYLSHSSGYGAYIDAGSNASSSTYALSVVKGATHYLYVRGDGNVGIGTASPNRLLDLNAATNSYMGWSEGGTEAWVAGYEGGSNRFIIYGGTPGGTKEYRMIMTDTGNVGIGSSTPAGRLHIKQSSNSHAGGFLQTRSDADNSWTLTSGGDNAFYWGYSTTSSGHATKMHLTSGGNLNPVGEVTAFYTSDERLKENVKSFKGLEMINRIEPVKFNWNDTAKELNNLKDDRTNYGIIAQQLEEVLPELVHPIYDGKYKSIDYVQLVSVLIQAVKEQQKQIYYLRTDLNYVMKNKI